MASTFTTLLRLNKPALGDAGWGTAVNGGFTDLADSAIAGTTTLNTDADVTLTTANGAADQARQMILNCTGARTAERTITAPAESKVYVIINGTSGGHGVRIAGVLPPTTTGVLVPAGRMAVVAWNGSDFVTLGAVVDLTASGNVSFDGGTFVFNESGADKDARFEGDTDANLLFLDASTDRVGIGTSTPGAKLEVDGVVLCTNTNGLFIRSNLGTPNSVVALDASNMLVIGGGGATDSIQFWSSGAERMRLDSSGRVGINGAAPGDSMLYAKNVTNASFAATFENTSALGYGISIGSDSSILAYFYPNGTRSGSSVGSISCTPTTTSYNQSSDRRLKTAVAPAADAGALLDAVQVVEFDWKVGGHTRYGVIAQDLHLLAPEAVTPGDSNEEVERPWGVDYSKLVPMLIKEVQSLRARVAALEAK